MARTRAWRRFKDFIKAKRKKKISDEVYTWISWDGRTPSWYSNLHQYSKNKIHCSCPMCSAKTKNKGHRRWRAKNYMPSYNPTMMDRRRNDAMKADLKENESMKYVHFWGSTGYAGTDYEEYVEFEDDALDGDIEGYSEELNYENAETYEYVARGWGEDWESDEDREEYYETAAEYAGWEYVTKEEYDENQE